MASCWWARGVHEPRNQKNSALLGARACIFRTAVADRRYSAQLLSPSALGAAKSHVLFPLTHLTLTDGYDISFQFQCTQVLDINSS